MPRPSGLRVLCVDDEPDILEGLDRLLRGEGCQVLLAQDGEAALQALQRHIVDLAILDIRMPGMGGLELLREIRTRYPRVEVMMLTGHGGLSDAIEALRLGASDFVQKPFEPAYMRQRVSVLRERQLLRDENRQLHALLRSPQPRRQLIGTSGAMKRIQELIARVQDDDCTVLIQGESGTGKEQIARSIHFGGRRVERPFVTIDCGALTPTLIESELFGHVKGSFTGAVADRSGLLETAADGTVFIDEITELELPLQSKLLRAIQEREIRPVGGSRSVPLSARIIAASRKDLEKEAKEGRFRDDLYYRLNVVELKIPPLRERREDIAPLVTHFLEKFGVTKRKVESVDERAMRALEAYDWPGNIRELEHCIERALVLGSGSALRPEELPLKVQDALRSSPGAAVFANSEDHSLAAFEKRAIMQVLQEAAGNKRQAARILDISVTTLYDKMKRYGLAAQDDTSGGGGEGREVGP